MNEQMTLTLTLYCQLFLLGQRMVNRHCTADRDPHQFQRIAGAQSHQCEHENALLMAVPQWEGVHPLLKILPVEWNHSIPFGLLHSPTPSPTVQRLIPHRGTAGRYRYRPWA